jgi:F0F1-type ATP synthase assembly protein I
VRHESVTSHIGAAVNEGRRDRGSFFGSILAGTLLGLGLDAWWGTDPVLVIAGVLAGVYAAFARLWHEMKNQPEHPAVTLQQVGEGET